jgi:hypothetical protein
MPAMTTKVTMIVLWTDELRIAAQALKRLNDLPDGAPDFALKFRGAKGTITTIAPP